MREALAAVGVGALAVTCCVLLPIIVVSLGSAALAPLIGAGAAAVALVLLVAIVIVRRRQTCRVQPGGGR